MSPFSGALDLADHVLDEGTFVRWDEAPLEPARVDAAYATALAAARGQDRPR